MGSPINEVRTMQPTDLERCAAIIDAAGHISAQKRYKGGTRRRMQGRAAGVQYRAYARVKTRDAAAIDLLCRVLGGWLVVVDRVTKHPCAPWYAWETTHEQAEKAIRTLLPYLRAKQPQAHLIAALLDLQRSSSAYRDNTRSRPLSAAYHVERQRMFDEIKRLNK